MYKYRFTDISHNVRSEQLIGQYGVGGMVDFQEQTLMVAAHDYWNANIKQVHDERLQKALGVSYFGMALESKSAQDGVSYVRFPEWYFCPKCRRFMPICKWVEEHTRFVKETTKVKDPMMMRRLKCYKCNLPLVVTRIVTICENGHIDDFPWIAWAHKKNRSGPKEICTNPQLLFKTGNSSSEGLEGLQVECVSCGAGANLGEAFAPKVFENLYSEKGYSEFKCYGRHPWMGKKCTCNAFPVAKQRGASAIYFPYRVSSLIIPVDIAESRKKIEASTTFKNSVEPVMMDCEDQEEKVDILSMKLARWSSRIATETGLDSETVEKGIKDIYLNAEDNDNYDINSVRYKFDEYVALSAPVRMENQLPDFYREEMDVSQYNIKGVDKIILIKKLREVQTLIGFSRVKPVDDVEEQSDRFVSIKSENTNWYPGVETHGEGIFIRFDNTMIDAWAKNDNVVKRIVALRDSNDKSSFSLGTVTELDAKFVMLHTLAHILIRQLSFECGYSVSSLKERIYSSSDDENSMAGILIYTASSDSEGTLGGLVRQGKSDSLSRIIKKAVEGAKICSNDPVCIMSNGQGREALNLAACYACGLLPETSCEFFNMYLDRAMLIGTLDNPDFGYFSERSIGINSVSNKKMRPMNKAIFEEVFAPVAVIYKNNGTDLKSLRYDDIWDYVLDETEDDLEIAFFSELKKLNDVRIEKPVFGETVVYGENKTVVNADLIWKKSKVMFFFSYNGEAYQRAKNTGWHVICLSESQITVEDFLNMLEDE